MSSSRNLVVLLPVLLLQQLLASFTFPIAKYGLAVVEPFTFAFYRYLISSVIFIAVVWWQKNEHPIERPDRIKLFGMGVLIIIFNQTLYLYGQSLTSAGHAALLFATVPLWIFLMAIVHLRERPTWQRAAGLIMALIGVIIVILTGAIEIGSEYLFGDLVILAAAITWAGYTVLGKPLVGKYGAFRVTAWALVSGSVAYFPFGLYRAMNCDYSAVTTQAWLSVIYVAVGTSVAAYALWYWLLKQMEASRLAVFQNLQPIIASAVAFVMLQEPLGWSFVIGGAIVLGGVVITEV
ncbi:MAG TPA: DMT family transporter [Candidatus Deferrimicrobium sp.]|nr:DMT family transporter [Candidatus Deferrimicrobium sp.]